MKYFMVNETDASGSGHTDYTYYALEDYCTLEDAKELYIESNDWIRYQECSRMKAFEIDLETYKAGLAFNEYVKVCRANDVDKAPDRKSYQLWETHNMFPTKKWAEMFARTTKPVLIGYPKMHTVHKMDDNRKLHFVYHYDSDIDFRDNPDRRTVFKTKFNK